MIIRTKAHPRAGLIGNPSDGYFGNLFRILWQSEAKDASLTMRAFGPDSAPLYSDQLLCYI